MECKAFFDPAALEMNIQVKLPIDELQGVRTPTEFLDILRPYLRGVFDDYRADAHEVGLFPDLSSVEDNGCGEDADHPVQIRPTPPRPATSRQIFQQIANADPTIQAMNAWLSANIGPPASAGQERPTRVEFSLEHPPLTQRRR